MRLILLVTLAIATSLGFHHRAIAQFDPYSAQRQADDYHARVEADRQRWEMQRQIDDLRRQQEADRYRQQEELRRIQSQSQPHCQPMGAAQLCF